MELVRDQDRVEFGKQLRTAREARGLSRAAIRPEIGLSESSVVRVERGDPVSLEVALPYAAFLDVNVPASMMRAEVKESIGRMVNAHVSAQATGDTASILEAISNVHVRVADVPVIKARVDAIAMDIAAIKEHLGISTPKEHA